MVYIEKTAHGSVRITGMSPIDMYPVGSIYMSTLDTNPATYWGGSWVRWGSGKVPVGVDTGDSSFNTVEKTGGEKEHILGTDEVPKHNHKQTVGNDNTVMYAKHYDHATNSVVETTMRTVSSGWPTPTTAPGRFDYTDWAETRAPANGHNNLQPYITCYMWKRTA